MPRTRSSDHGLDLHAQAAGSFDLKQPDHCISNEPFEVFKRETGSIRENEKLRKTKDSDGNSSHCSSTFTLDMYDVKKDSAANMATIVKLTNHNKSAFAKASSQHHYSDTTQNSSASKQVSDLTTPLSVTLKQGVIQVSCPLRGLPYENVTNQLEQMIED